MFSHTRKKDRDSFVGIPKKSPKNCEINSKYSQTLGIIFYILKSIKNK